MPAFPATETLVQLSARLVRGEIRSRDLVAACLDRIAAMDPRLHAFSEVWGDAAMRVADARDLERAAGMPCGPLHGIPLAIKDLFEVEGRRTSGGSRHWHDRTSAVTATAVQRLLAAGMVPLGKTHMVEFAFGTWGTNVPMGAPWNPWDLDVHRVTGGSSSGSAVAVAAGLAPAALGSDTGGSVRIPAALCGITGFKPTYGFISLYGTLPLSPTLDSVGPLTRSVDDAILLTAAMAGADAADPATLNAPRFDGDACRRELPDLRGRRISLLPPEALPALVEPEVRAALDRASAVLRDLGALVEPVAPPFDFAALGGRNGRLIAMEAYWLHHRWIDDDRLPFDPGVRKRVRGGREATALEYLEALAERRRASLDYAAWMAQRDALLTPTVPMPAIPLAEVDEDVAPMSTFTRAINYLGGCALSLPAGVSCAGLPIGVQLAGGPWADARILAIGRALQSATDWHRATPSLPDPPGR